MLSIIIYGRNDNHGYNLHKRAAISMNCLSEMLEHEDDELLFVDYNSADDLPTFPEAIQDTLSQRARDKLRVFRVRPRIHRKFRERTHLEVLEPVARNVAIRRSNPANPWILSTNGDVIVVPRTPGRTLSTIAAGLSPGFYQTPRFEVPETLWESFDRADPERVIKEIRVLGISARLNEVVYASDPILYDGPGDFQLIRRDDLIEIDGFDEEMIFGWHVDSNLVARLALKYGPVRSLVGEVFCYHCDHTRQPTVAHGGKLVGNDYRRYVDEVKYPALPWQRQRWGCAEEVIEEIRMVRPGAAVYRNVIESTLSPLDRDFTEARYTSDTFDTYRYDPAHVLPFLADLLSHYPRDTSLAWCGVQDDMLQLTGRAWQRLGFERPIMVDGPVAAALREAPGLRPAVARTDWLEQADLFVFEFGLATGAAAADAAPPAGHGLRGVDADALLATRSAFLDAVEHERYRLADNTVGPRRFVGVNCIHNRMERLFAAHVGTMLTPFSSRLRHGFVMTAALRTPAGSGATAMPMIAAPDRARAVDRGAPMSIAAGCGTSAPHQASQQHEKMSAELGVAVVDGRSFSMARRSLSRFACFEDWDDPYWARFSEQWPPENTKSRRRAELWEQAHLLYGLERSGQLGRGMRILVVAAMPDAVIGALTERGARVEVLVLSREAAPGQADERLYWADGAPRTSDRLTILAPETGLTALASGAYDAVLFPHGSMFGSGLTGAIQLLAEGERLIGIDGMVAFKAEVAAGPEPDLSFLDTSLVGENGLAAQLAEYTGFTVEGGFDPRLTRASAERAWPLHGPIAGEPYFLSRQNGRLLMPSLWFLRRDRQAPEHGWERLQQWAGARLLGEQVHRLRVGAAGWRDQEGRIVTIPGREGHVFFGPYIAVPNGRYRVSVALEKPVATDADLVLEAVADGGIVVSTLFDREAVLSARLVTEFVISRSDPLSTATIEIRAYSSGDANLTVTSVRLSSISAFADGDNKSAASGVAAAQVPAGPRSELGLPVTDRHVPPAERPLSRLAACEDWDDPSWSRFLQPLASAPLPSSLPRNGDAWERSQILYGLSRIGKLVSTSRVLVAAMRPDVLIAALSEKVRRADVIDMAGASPRPGARGRLYWSHGGLYARDRLMPLERGTWFDALEDGQYDAVVFPHSSILARGVGGMAGMIKAAERVLAQGGALVFSAEVAVGSDPNPSALSASLVRKGGFEAELAAATGLVVDGGFDPRLSRATLEQLRSKDGSHRKGGRSPRRNEDRTIVPSVWFVRKHGPTSAPGWDRIQQYLGDIRARASGGTGLPQQRGANP